MTIVEVNGANIGSTGKIMFGIADCARKRRMNVITFSASGHSQVKGVPNHYFIGNRFGHRLSERINYLFSSPGSLNLISTIRLIGRLKEIKPDIIHLHNLHGDYVNLNMLFHYIKANNSKVVWTLHDCWSFTGQCPHFEMIGCEKWKTGCYECPAYHDYPATRKDNSRRMFRKKKNWFCGIDNLTIVTPSNWLAGLVKESFLKEYPVKVINNGIDLTLFHYIDSDFREKYSLEHKFIVLGVSFFWGIKKGLDRFEELSRKLDDRFRIVLVGIEKEKVEGDRILCIPRTDNQKELAEIYSSADVLLNPTREDNYPTINLEALACGTPVLSYGCGGSAEALNKNCGAVVSDNNIVSVLNQLIIKNFDRQDCILRGMQFGQDSKYNEYVDLYARKYNYD